MIVRASRRSPQPVDRYLPDVRLSDVARRAREADRSASDWAWFAIGWIGVPIFAIVIIVGTASGLGPTWRAARHEGHLGTFVAGRRSCSQSASTRHTTCDWYGDFTSEDRSVVLTNTLLDADPRGLTPGASVRTIDTGTRHPSAVYLPGGWSEWLIVAGLFTVAIIVLIAWAVVAWMRWIRPPRDEGSDPEPPGQHEATAA